MTTEAESTRATGISESLCKDFHDHGYAVGRKEAKQLGLKVVDEPETEKLAWQVWTDFEMELEARSVFTPLMALLQSPQGAKLTAPVPQITIPPGTPTAVAQAAYQMAIQTVNIDPVDVDLVLALVESPRLASRCVDKLRIFGSRNADMNVEYGMVLLSRGWKAIDLPQPSTNA